MEELEDIYTENYLQPVRNTAPPSLPSPTREDRVLKVHANFSALILSLDTLKDEFESNQELVQYLSDMQTAIKGIADTYESTFSKNFSNKIR